MSASSESRTVEVLDDAGSEHRYRAVRELAAEAPGALETLVERLSDESWRVRKAALEKLTEIRPPERAIAPLVGLLGGGADVPGRNAAAEALARIGVPAVCALAESTRAPDPDLRKLAVDILGQIGHLDAVESLAQALDDADRNVRAAAAEALGKVGGPRASIALERALRIDDPLLRACALDGLSRTGAAPRIELLEALVRGRLLRRAVYRLLGRHPDERALELLLEGLSDPGRSTREAALAGVAEQARKGSGLFAGRLALLLRRVGLQVEAAIKASREALQEGEGGAVEGALLVLGVVGGAEDAAAIAERCGDDRLRGAALAALAGLGEVARGALGAALDQLSPAGLAAACEVLGEERAGEAARRALVALDTCAPEEASLLVAALGEVGGPMAVEGLLARLDDPGLGRQVAQALSRVARRRPAEVGAIARRLWAEEASPAACFLLGEVGAPEDALHLCGALRHSEPRVRIAAARALGALRAPGHAGALSQGLTDESAEVRAACLRALCALPAEGLQLPAEGLENIVRGALTDSALAVATAAAQVAGEAGLVGLAEPLAALLGHAGPLALAALESLERMGRLDRGVLARASDHPSPEVCQLALTLASERPWGMELIRQRLAHERWEVRRASARVMGRVGAAEALPALRSALGREGDPLVAEALAQAIAAVEGRR